MRKLYFTGTIAMVLFLFNSCKKTETTIKEEYNPNIPIYGTWKIIDAPMSGYEEMKYLSFTSSKNCTVYSSSPMGFKSSYSSSFVPYPDQIIADLLGYSQAMIYNYKMKGDTLIIDMGGMIVLHSIKAPATDINGWAEEVPQTDEILGLFSQRSFGIGYDGVNLLLPDYNKYEITKINLSTRLPAGAISVSGAYPHTVEFDGTDIWVSSNGYSNIYRYSLSGGSALSMSPQLGAWVYGIAFDPALNQIWAFANNEDSLYQFNKTTNLMVGTRYIGRGFYDMAWSNGKLFITRGPYIYRMNTSSFTIEKTYRLKSGHSIYGIAAVGSDFWLNIVGDRLVKVTLN